MKARQQQRVSIHDVAKDAGVALSTVSKALAGKGYVSDETRKKVQDAANRLGYSPSAVARALRMQRTFTIGVLMPDISNPSFSDFMRGVEDVANREGCSLLTCNTDDLVDKQIAHMRVLLSRQVDGLVLLSQHCEQPEVRELLQPGTPFVLVQRRSLNHDDDYVGADNLGGIAAAVKHLAELGHRRIAFIKGPEHSSTVQDRLAAYRKTIAACKLVRDESLIVQGNYQVDGGYEAAKRLLAMEGRPTAIIAANDMSAMGVLDAAHEMGLRVPADLSVVGVDDIQMAALSFVNLTTIRLQRRKMGEAAAELLMQRIRRKKRGPAKELSFPMDLVVRGSTAAPASLAALPARPKRVAASGAPG